MRTGNTPTLTIGACEVFSRPSIRINSSDPAKPKITARVTTDTAISLSVHQGPPAPFADRCPLSTARTGA
ncbi:hypothetical protein ACFWF3_24880 [Nocardia sp. NPDC060220]|uniref:hypothetical protein n=1 Tax=Nocardia sp. NPDC060220 TaxID=3347076 RepID=UPI00364F9D7C